jgi:hypothetical protein
MPLSKDPLGGGTEASGAHSSTYCSYCYGGGKFKQPDYTLAQMNELVEQKLREQGVPGFMAKWLAGSTKKLERWKA